MRMRMMKKQLPEISRLSLIFFENEDGEVWATLATWEGNSNYVQVTKAFIDDIHPAIGKSIGKDLWVCQYHLVRIGKARNGIYLYKRVEEDEDDGRIT